MNKHVFILGAARNKIFRIIRILDDLQLKSTQKQVTKISNRNQVRF